jgi:hypothetical protein
VTCSCGGEIGGEVLKDVPPAVNILTVAGIISRNCVGVLVRQNIVLLLPVGSLSFELIRMQQSQRRGPGEPPHVLGTDRALTKDGTPHR